MSKRLFTRTIGAVAAAAGLALASTGVAAAQQPAAPTQPPGASTPAAQTDLSVGLAVDERDIEANEDVSYTVSVTNHGTVAAENVELRVDLDRDFVIEDASERSRGSDDEERSKASWSLGTLGAGQTVEVEIEGHYEDDGRSRSEASVSSSTADPNSSNDEDEDELDIE